MLILWKAALGLKASASANLKPHDISSKKFLKFLKNINIK